MQRDRHIAAPPRRALAPAARGVRAIGAASGAPARGATPLVRPGGLLIYATCSLEPEENERAVESLLTQYPEFARTPRSELPVPTELLTAAGDFQSLPQRRGIEGAYAARLISCGSEC